MHLCCGIKFKNISNTLCNTPRLCKAPHALLVASPLQHPPCATHTNTHHPHEHQPHVHYHPHGHHLLFTIFPCTSTHTCASRTSELGEMKENMPYLDYGMWGISIPSPCTIFLWGKNYPKASTWLEWKKKLTQKR